MHRIVVHSQDWPAQVVRVAAGIEEQPRLNLVELLVSRFRALRGYQRQSILQVEVVDGPIDTLGRLRIPARIARPALPRLVGHG